MITHQVRMVPGTSQGRPQGGRGPTTRRRGRCRGPCALPAGTLDPGAGMPDGTPWRPCGKPHCGHGAVRDG